MKNKKEKIKLPKKLSEDFGYGKGITRERYRQMKLKLRNRWKQIEQLEEKHHTFLKWVQQILENYKQDKDTSNLQNIINDLEYLIYHMDK